MKTEIEELDKILNLQNPQLILITGIEEIEKKFIIDLATKMALKQNIPTALFHNTEIINIKDEISSNYYKIDINKINEQRFSEENLNEQEIKKGKKNGKIDVCIDEINNKKIYLPYYFLNQEQQTKLENGYKKIDNSKLYIQKISAYEVDKFEEKCKILKMDHNIKIILIDELKTINSSKTNIFKKLRELSKELNVVIIVANPIILENINLSVPLEKQIEEYELLVKMSDVVLFMKELSEEKQSIVNITVAKNINGNIGKIEALYLKNYIAFVEIIKYFS